MNKPTHAKHAMTLIEVLVAAAMFGVLVGTLAPALGGARERSLRQAELGNLRTIINLAHTYASRDPRNILGPVHRLNGIFINEGYADYGGGPGLSPYTGWDTGGSPTFDPPTRPFNRLLYGPDNPNANTAPGDRSVFKPFQCLGEDLGWQSWPGFGGFSPIDLETENPYYKTNGTSFRQNNLPGGNFRSIGIYGHSVQCIPAPSLTVAYMEARALETVSTNEVWGALGGGIAEKLGELAGYHKKRGFFMVSYADGHAGLVDFGHGTYFEHHDPAQRDVRGTWGRMDTLPAPGFSDFGGAGFRQTANDGFHLSLIQEN